MGALDAVEWELPLLEPVRNREAERQLRQALGFVSPGPRYFLDSAWLTRAITLIDVGHIPLLHVTPDLSEMVALVVSQENSCRYCYAATRSAMLILGFPESRIRQLEEDFLRADLPPVEKQALEFARFVSRASPLPTWRDARPLLDAGYSPSAVKELAFLVVANVFFNRLSTLAALPPQEMEALSRRWYVRLLRPVLAPLIRARRARQAEFLAPAQREGPFAAVVNELDGLPAAGRLRAVIDAAWEPSSLTRRVKGLVLAVIARGIGCARTEREATRLLIEEGMTVSQVADTLAHLSGPSLDPLEGAAVSLARESIWYRPAPLQKHARSLRAHFTREQFVEVCGIAALANMLSRLAPVIDTSEPGA